APPGRAGDRPTGNQTNLWSPPACRPGLKPGPVLLTRQYSPVRKGASMFIFRKFKVASHERALVFHEGEFRTLLMPGKYKLLDPLRKLKVEKVNLREVYFKHENLDVLAREFLLRKNLDGEVKVLELADHERAFVFVDGRFDRILKPGLHVLWIALRKVRIEVIDTREPVYASADLPRIVRGGTI